jgi:hypothetical protein
VGTGGVRRGLRALALARWLLFGVGAILVAAILVASRRRA